MGGEARPLTPEGVQRPERSLRTQQRDGGDGVEAALSTRETTMREYWVLTCLIEGDAASQSALSTTLAIDASDMVRLIDALEAKDWARRERDPRDRRRQIVTSTKTGAKAQAQLAVIVAQAEKAEVAGLIGSIAPVIAQQATVWAVFAHAEPSETLPALQTTDGAYTVDEYPLG